MGIPSLVILSFFISWKDVWLRLKHVKFLYLSASIATNMAFLGVETIRLKRALEYPKLRELLRIFSLSRLIGVGTVHIAGEGTDNRGKLTKPRDYTSALFNGNKSNLRGEEK